jgi:hypothetical protein
MTGQNLVLQFSETVTAIEGKKVNIRATRKTFTYEDGLAYPQTTGFGRDFIYTIPSGFSGISGTDSNCMVTIPLSSFIVDKGDKNLVEYVTYYINTDFYRANTVTVEAGAFEDLSGNKAILYGSNNKFYSKMAKAPFLYTITPATESTNVPISGNIIVTFNKQLDKLTGGSVVLTPGNIALTGGTWSGGAAKEYLSGGVPAGDEYTYSDGNVYTVPYSGLNGNTQYTITVSGFTDPDGNTMASNSSGKFTTETITPTLISASALTVTAPVANIAPDTTVTGTTGQFSATAAWNGNPPLFGYATQYTATFTLTAIGSTTFTGGFTNTGEVAGFTINGNAPTFVSNNGMTLVLSYQFAATAAEPDVTAPQLTAAAIRRTSDTAATIGFTSDETGTAYYTVVEKDAAAPTIASVDDVKSLTSLGAISAGRNAEMAISLTAGDKDIYVYAVDASENYSSLKITAAAYDRSALSAERIADEGGLAVIKITNVSACSVITGTAYLAAYDSQGKMLDLQTTPLLLAANEDCTIKSGSDSVGATRYKLFVLSNSFAPMLNCYTFG